MDATTSIFLYVVLLIVPVIVLFVIIYYLSKRFLHNQYKLQYARTAQDDTNASSRLKLQAYERLILFCERISVNGLLLRLQSSKMSAMDLQAALILAVQQEYEYNLSQQLYVSDQLWKIISLVKNQTIETITTVASSVEKDASAEDLSQQLILFIESQNNNPVETAKTAIKQESSLIL